MTDKTQEMIQARRDLQQLAVSDPAVVANMMRYLSALAILVTGRRGRDLVNPEPIFVAAFQTDRTENLMMRKTAMLTGLQHVVLAFDVDDATSGPCGLGVFRTEGEMQVCYDKCRLWAPANDGRAVIVPTETHHAIDGHFVFRRGRQLVRVAAPAPADLEAGFLRGARRLVGLANSEALRDVSTGAFQTTISNAGRGRLDFQHNTLAA